jgi:enoyl-CoA hydratase
MGLANRVVPRGKAREEAEAVARTIAGFPPACVRSDLRSAYEAQGKTFETALRREFALGLKTLKTGESLKSARRFASLDFHGPEFA